MATRTMHDAATREFRAWLSAGGRHRTDGADGLGSEDGETWRGPTEAAWTKRLLRGAPPPRESGGTIAAALVAHG